MVRKAIGHTFIFLFLTILTQIGGICYIFSVLIARRIGVPFRFKTLSIFLGLYSAVTFMVVPHLAPKFGRTKIAFLEPANFATVLLNRNYIKSEYHNTLRRINGNLQSQNIQLHFLDANFPFIDGFPLLPHLSHNDGRKMDLSLIYETTDGKISENQKSNSGYGVFEGPRPGEIDQISKCKKAGYIQYDYPRYLTFGRINNELVFSKKGTKQLIEELLQEHSVEKIFLEPHLKERLSLYHNKIRYHGCRAVRHDDHIHVQFK